MEEKTMAAEISVEENPFNRLPKELVVSIFNKISDAKCLCMCSSVSKNFAADVLQTRVLFVEMPCFFTACTCHPDPSAARPSHLVLSFLRDIPYFLFKPLMVMWSLLKSRFKLGDETALSDIMNSRKKFSCVDSMTFHFPLHDGNSSVQTENDIREEIRASLLSMVLHLMDCTVRLGFVYKIVDILPNIKHVVAVDNMKQGRVIFDDEKIPGMKEKCVLMDKFFLKLWKAPLVKVLVAGCIMEEVSLIWIRRIGGCDASEAKNSFEEEEYRELSMILVKEEACFQKITSLSNILVI